MHGTISTNANKNAVNLHNLTLKYERNSLFDFIDENSEDIPYLQILYILYAKTNYCIRT